MANSITTDFPSQIVSDLEKQSSDYGLEVARAIEKEWFDGPASNRYSYSQKRFHDLRLYARGEQSVQKYKDELSINGDLSYLNLDWKPVPIIPKFVDIVVNGMSARNYDVSCYAQDEYGVSKRTAYMETILRDMKMKDFNAQAKKQFNVKLAQTDEDKLPDSVEELELHMQLDYKQSVETANEQAINVLLKGNKYDLTRRRVLRDITVCGIGAVKTNFDYSRGVTVEYVDPANLVYSHTESPYFEDVYYVGEVKTIPINELIREFPSIDKEELKELKTKSKRYSNRSGHVHEKDKNKVQVLYFNWKTFHTDTYKVKKTSSGADKAIPKPDTFKAPSSEDAPFSRLARQVEVLYEGAMVVGTNKLLKWQVSENMMRDKSDYNKVRMNYSVVAPRMYNGKIESLVGRITGFADMIQLTHLKLQQVMSRMVPDGVYLDADGLAEIDLGNGTNYNPQEALNMFFQTGSVLGRSFTQDGDPNPGKIPIQQIQSGAGSNKIQSLTSTYNYYLQMIRDVTGLNEARDASTPDANSLVGVQKLAAANSNVATRHILQAMLFLTEEVAESVSLRVSDIIEYSPTRDAFVQAIGAHNVATLKEMSELHLYDFGIFIQLAPDEEEKQMLENNISLAISQKLIDLDDAIDIREVRNLKLANQLLKLKKKKKLQRDQQIQQENQKSQAQAQSQAQQAAAQAEVQKAQQLTETQKALKTHDNTLKLEYLKQEALMKRQLMDHEFEINKKLRQMELQQQQSQENMREDRKDERQAQAASQQSQMIEQKKGGKPPKRFESAGNDSLGSGQGINIGGLTKN
tara:strand:+ start:1080 stop:3491 length:2412 start_codon:yes stop_codon:yes gene_type:complete